MIRKLQRTGLIGLAICALGILGAAPASAEFHSSAEHTVLDGKQVGTDSLVFNAGKITCTSITYSGTQSAQTSSTASLGPAYSGCNAFGFAGVTIDSSGCQLVLHTATNLTDISCGEKPITVTAPNCTLTIGSQAGLASSTFATEGAVPKRDVKAKLALTGVKYTQVGSGGTPCTSKEFTDGAYTAEITVTGTNTAGSQVEFVTEPAPAGGLFHAAGEHTILDGVQIGEPEDVFTFNFNTVSCPETTYSGTHSTNTSAAVTLTPVFKKCLITGIPVITMDVNGCAFAFHAFPSKTVDINCPEKPIEITFGTCHVKVSSQSLAGVTYTSEGTTPERDVRIAFNLSGIKYTQENKLFPGCTGGAGSFSNGTFKGVATVRGTDTAGSRVDFWFA